MSNQLHSTIEIEAPPSRVWEVLTDFAAYPDWNPFVRRIAGQPIVGSRLEAHIQPPGGRGTTIRPAVLAAEPERELRWIGYLGTPGIFDGEHRFRIEPIGPDRVRFIQEERFSGLLAPLILRFIEHSTLEGFAAMNRALKARAEHPPAHE
ncbi:MAG: SRPBCC family protein [Thermomicrobiales bacterium]